MNVPSDPQREPNAGQSWDHPHDPRGHQPAQAADKQLRAAIRRTLEQAAQDQYGEQSHGSPLEAIVKVVRRHPTVAAVTDLQVAAELVCELGKHALPAQIFHAAIQRASPEIASALLADPNASHHLAKAWLSARAAAGLTEA